MSRQSFAFSISSRYSLCAALALGAPAGCFDPGQTADSTALDGSGGPADATTGGPSDGDSGATETAEGSTGGEATAGDDGSTGGDGSPGASGDDTGEELEAGGTIIPLYTYPTDPTWATVAAEAMAHPEVEVVAIVNPGSGPGQAPDPNYEAGIAALADAGVTVIGYVYTSYAARPVAEVQADIDAYADFYPEVAGVMLDEMSNVRGDEAYYAGISAYAAGSGLGLSVGNPGTSVPESFVETVDALFIYESQGLPDTDGFEAWLGDYDRESFAIIPHTVAGLEPEFVHEALEHVGWIYVTDDMLPNPWDSLPPYFGELMDQLAAG